MSTFVLVHGAWGGGWVWDRVAGVLRQQGHTVHTPDLPGHGSDGTPTAKVTLQSYVDRICQVIDGCNERVILAGHSMGGIVISQAAEERSGRISALVYVTAFLLQDGQCLLQWAELDKDSQVPPNFIFSDDKVSITLKRDGIRDALLADCDPQDVERIIGLLVPQAAEPLTAAVHLSAGNFGRVPRVYVECLRDRAISINIQREMRTASPCVQVFSLDCDHSPMFSRPQELAECLLATAHLEDRTTLSA
jgi:pimeloyl-ACP methyl ester carboxylesterase